MKKLEHIINKVLPGSIAEEMGMEPGDKLLQISDTDIEDIFDYQYYRICTTFITKWITNCVIYTCSICMRSNFNARV